MAILLPERPHKIMIPQEEYFVRSPRLITRILTSKFLLPILFAVLAGTALIRTVSLVHATPSGITQKSCINCGTALMLNPYGMAIDSAGNIYITVAQQDFAPAGIWKYSADGVFQKQLVEVGQVMVNLVFLMESP